MSTAAIHPATIDLTQTPRTPFARLVRVELRKSHNTRSGLWLLAGMGLLTTAIYVVMLLMVALGSSDFGYGNFVNGAASGMSILLPILGILLVTSEWSQRTAMTSFTLEPHRPRVILAKLATGLLLTVVVTAFALIAGALATLANDALGGSASWNFGPKYIVGLIITQSLAMLGGFALATLLLNSPAAIVAFFVYKLIVPTIFSVVGQLAGGFKDVLPWIDFQSAQTPLLDLSVHGEDWAHLAVTGTVWLVLPFALGLWRVLRAEVK
jgi:ABC-2 type transport system permease protein